MKHIAKNRMHINPVNIDLIGVGGGGSLVLSGLVRLHLAMKSLGSGYRFRSQCGQTTLCPK